jgi:hypothetical protein
MAISVPDFDCLAGFCITVYKGSPGGTVTSERFVYCSRKLSAFCLMAYTASWICFVSTLMFLVFNVRTLTTMKRPKTCLMVFQGCSMCSFFMMLHFETINDTFHPS